MGTCFSKKKGSSPVVNYVAISSAPAALAEVDPKSKPPVPGKQEQIEEESKVKKEIFIIKHRKSHDDRDKDCTNPLGLQQNLPQKPDGVAASASITSAATTTTENCNQVSVDDKKAAASTSVGVRVRTSSCNKEEVDAILIQCGRLSRSSSGKAASSSSASCDRGKKYSGSKRSYDFDNCENDYQVTATSEDAKSKIENNNEDFSDEKTHHHRQRHRQSPSSQGRRRTPSRERNQQQRSSSRERRTSRSPGRRLSLEQNNTNCNANSTSAAATANFNSDTNNRPGKMKMISVPATVSVSSLVMDKSNNGESTTIKRISVKRNAGEGSRTAASPRSQSPARGGSNTKASNDSLQPSLSRSSSRKAEQSPYRRNPLSELDPNSLAYPQPHIHNTNNKSASSVVNQLKTNVEINSNKTVAQGINYRSSTSTSMDNKAVEPAVASGVDCFKPQTVTRSRSSRRSRDLDINPETLSNPPPSYTRLLLQDIQNFHQQSTNTAVVSLPQCVTKACSILEAVADLNSTTSSSHVTSAFSADRKIPPIDQINKSSCYYNSSLGANLVQRKDIPFVESEVLVDDDLMEPSFHKYVTVRRGGADMEDQESSGSNSFVSGSQQPHWGFSSSWEPNSTDSTDCWTSRSNTREDDRSFDMDEAARRRLSGRKTDGHNPHSSGGIGRGKLATTTKGLHTIPAVAAAVST